MILAMIIGMSLVTMIPRVIPAFVVDKLRFPNWLNRLLNAIPYAALGALIFPGIMNVIPDKPYVGLIGGIVAIILAYFGLHVIYVLVGSIVTVFLFTL
ncbi:AzlD domain-containing protein [Aquibacillus sp. 3ASR75-11]|uniref:AzlD domain-containing protein n=1 Tax=Terrihalobacillus insolitus TaxID=2950438 RepID=A0A9X3WSK9_9BACI|nr:AzlD domain-containing protein [Terrihalobacillus insolitus]MDC3413563.1 AzlD domain-containing protein [Terrihalobacillus insolitus]MDC3424680.1 AzlD domain-containing protein [Terrihalobacillus insolitus]